MNKVRSQCTPAWFSLVPGATDGVAFHAGGTPCASCLPPPLPPPAHRSVSACPVACVSSDCRVPSRPRIPAGLPRQASWCCLSGLRVCFSPFVLCASLHPPQCTHTFPPPVVPRPTVSCPPSSPRACVPVSVPVSVLVSMCLRLSLSLPISTSLCLFVPACMAPSHRCAAFAVHARCDFCRVHKAA